MKLNQLFAATVFGLAALFGWGGTGHAADQIIKVDQVIDLNALVPEKVYQFVPDYLWVEPGDTIRFLNSLGNHTVTSLKGVWPEGAERVDIEHQAVADVILEVPGVYGFRCKVHGRHGMYALVVVGAPDSNLDSALKAKVGGRSKKVFEGLLGKLKADIAKRGN